MPCLFRRAPISQSKRDKAVAKVYIKRGIVPGCHTYELLEPYYGQENFQLVLVLLARVFSEDFNSLWLDYEMKRKVFDLTEDYKQVVKRRFPNQKHIEQKKDFHAQILTFLYNNKLSVSEYRDYLLGMSPVFFDYFLTKVTYAGAKDDKKFLDSFRVDREKWLDIHQLVRLAHFPAVLISKSGTIGSLIGFLKTIEVQLPIHILHSILVEKTGGSKCCSDWHRQYNHTPNSDFALVQLAYVSKKELMRPDFILWCYAKDLSEAHIRLLKCHFTQREFICLVQFALVADKFKKLTSGRLEQVDPEQTAKDIIDRRVKVRLNHSGESCRYTVEQVEADRPSLCKISYV